MKLNVRAVFVSSWAVAAASYAICALFVAVAPATTSQSSTFELVHSHRDTDCPPC